MASCKHLGVQDSTLTPCLAFHIVKHLKGKTAISLTPPDSTNERPDAKTHSYNTQPHGPMARRSRFPPPKTTCPPYDRQRFPTKTQLLHSFTLHAPTSCPVSKSRKHCCCTPVRLCYMPFAAAASCRLSRSHLKLKKKKKTLRLRL